MHRLSRLGAEWEEQSHSGALAQLTLKAQLAVMIFDEPFGEVDAKPRPIDMGSAFIAVKFIAHARNRFLAHPRPVVGYGDFDTG